MAIARVASQIAGNRAATTSVTCAMPNNVTSGNVVIVCTASARDGAAPGNHLITKNSGTSTIDTVVEDGVYTMTSGTDQFRLEINTVPITGSGTLTLKLASANAQYCTIAVNEYTGLSTIDGSVVTNTGNGTTISTGNITGHGDGLMVGFGITIEADANTNYASGSDTLIYSLTDNQLYQSMYAQDRLVTSDETHAITNSQDSNTWMALGAAYLSTVIATTNYLKFYRRPRFPGSITGI